MDISKTQEKINQHLQGLKLCISELNEIETDIKKFMSLQDVEILVYPSDDVFRLRDERLRGYNLEIIKYESDLDKTLDDFIEKITVQSVSFEQSIFDSITKAPFKVVYNVNGYHAHNNKYGNKDFGTIIFKHKSELIEA